MFPPPLCTCRHGGLPALPCGYVPNKEQRGTAGQRPVLALHRQHVPFGIQYQVGLSYQVCGAPTALLVHCDGPRGTRVMVPPLPPFSLCSSTCLVCTAGREVQPSSRSLCEPW